MRCKAVMRIGPIMLALAFPVAANAGVHIGIGLGFVPPVLVPPPVYYDPPPQYYSPPPPLYYGPGVVYGNPGWDYGGYGWRDRRWRGEHWGHDRGHGERGWHGHR